MSFKDFVCTLSFEAGPGLTEGAVINYKEVVCHYRGISSSSRQNVPLFIYSFHTQKAYCRAYDISPVQARVCQSYGDGKDSSCPGSLGHCNYFLNEGYSVKQMGLLWPSFFWVFFPGRALHSGAKIKYPVFIFSIGRGYV